LLGPLDYHDDEVIAVFVHDLIHHRWLEQMAVFIDPFFEVERAGYHIWD
jgi:hypothetical protein